LTREQYAAEAVATLRKNLCEFPARFAKSVVINTPDAFHTATTTLVNLGRGPLAITCDHVIRDFVERWSDGTAMIRIGNVRVSSTQLVAHDRDIDLAIIRLSHEQAADLVNEEGLPAEFYQPSRWPPEPAKEEESVAIGGFPAQWRKVRHETREIILPYYGIGATPVTSASDRQFGCRFEQERWVWMSRAPELDDLSMLGGLSGGPVFAERHLHRALIGIVTEHWKDANIMMMAHTHWIKEDGSLLLGKRPWL